MANPSNQPTPLISMYPNGQVMAVGNHIWNGTIWVPWDGDVTVAAGGLGLPIYDALVVTAASTTDTYVFKVGGTGGTTVATVVLTYTDSTKTVLSTVVKT